MSVTSNRSINISFAGDVTFSEQFAATANLASPGVIELKSLSTGFNPIAVPSSVGFVTRAVTIIPPVGNTATIILKGVTGDTGVGLSPTEPSSFELVSGSTQIGLTVGSTIAGMRFIWT